jgi:ketosteroid isomerase-like protein
VDREVAEAVLGRLHAAQGELYAGGDTEPVREVLTDDVAWHVPGRNAIAGSYRGIDEVIGYFVRRRALAENTFRLHPGELMVGDGEHVAVLTDGTAVIAGIERRWSTIGLYRIRHDRVAACWLLPLDPEAFDEIWSPR